jgi:hypothetical protein
VKEEPGSGSITIADAHEVLRQTDKTAYLVSRRDWKRLRKMLDGCRPGNTSFYEGAGWSLVGIVAASVLSLIGLELQAEAKFSPWLVPTHILVAIFAAIVGYALLKLAREKKAEATVAISVVCSEFDDIESGYGPTAEGPPKEPQQR